METDFRGLQERLRRRLLDEIAAGELTGLQLARETGFQQAHISNFLNRKRGLSLAAMDEILRVRKLTLASLLAGAEKAKARRRSLQANGPGVTWIPIVDAKNCHASEVPFALTRNLLEVMSQRLGRLRPKVMVPRSHWQRFVAMHVTDSEAWAMAPRLARGAMVVIDRYSNAVEEGEIYAVRRTTPLKPKDGSHEAPTHNVGLRYVQRLGADLVLRGENRGCPLEKLSDATDVIGKVCLIIEER